MVESFNLADDPKYAVPFEYKKFFSPENVVDLVTNFKNYDKNEDGVMDKSEFKVLLHDLGYRDLTDARIDELLKKADKNKDGKIAWIEFLDMMSDVAEHK